MHITSSTALRSDYNTVSSLAKDTQEPIYITKNGEGDLVVMSIEAFEFREEMIRLKASLEAAEQYRLEGGMTFSLEESRKSTRLVYDDQV